MSKRYTKMLLNTETIYNDSKKISELRKLTTITKHQENSWVPIAQYNSRTNTYVNAAINLQAITSYTASYTYSYIGQEFGYQWIRLKLIGEQENYVNLEKTISNSGIANNIVSYAFTYTLQHLDWQIVDGTYVPEYYIPLHPDDKSGNHIAMSPPLFPNIDDEELDNEEATDEEQIDEEVNQENG